MATSLERLQDFFATSPAAARATATLSADARVDLALDEGPAHFTREAGAPEVRPGPSGRPDFTLRLPPGAVERVTAVTGDDVGALGIAFFELVLERDPALKVGLRLDAPTGRLVAHGYLAVLALGGVKVGWWLMKKGFANPLAVIERLRRRSSA
ncbi:MAG: AAA family ATPase [Anaeromyxobacteraceae bacterium]